LKELNLDLEIKKNPSAVTIIKPNIMFSSSINFGIANSSNNKNMF